MDFRNQNPSRHLLEPVIWDEANEVSMLVTGVVPEINVCRLVMMRFTEPIEMQQVIMRKVVVKHFSYSQVFPKMNNIRHLFFLIGPQLEDMEYLDMGRALATVVSNPVSVFTERQLVKFSAKSVAWVDNFEQLRAFVPNPVTRWKKRRVIRRGIVEIVETACLLHSLWSWPIWICLVLLLLLFR